MIFIILLTFILLFLAISFLNTYTTPLRKIPKQYPSKEKAHTFHEPIGNYEDTHADRVGTNLIKHPEAEIGYVVLNGVKRKIEDCKNL